MTLQVVHHEVVPAALLSNVVDRDDVEVVKPRGSPSLAQEALHELLVESAEEPAP